MLLSTDTIYGYGFYYNVTAAAPSHHDENIEYNDDADDKNKCKDRQY